MPQLIQPGINGPGTADVLSGVLHVCEGSSGMGPRGRQGVQVRMQRLRGMAGRFADAATAAAYAQGCHATHDCLIRYSPKAAEAVRAALDHCAASGIEVSGVDFHPWVTLNWEVFGGLSPEEMRSLNPSLAWNGLP